MCNLEMFIFNKINIHSQKFQMCCEVDRLILYITNNKHKLKLYMTWFISFRLSQRRDSEPNKNCLHNYEIFVWDKFVQSIAHVVNLSLYVL